MDTAEIEWVPIPGGTFEMGSSSGSGDEKPVHTVHVSSFELMKTEVTFGQYSQCVAAGACTPAHTSDGTCWTFDNSWKPGQLSSVFQGADQPIVCVEWSQAQAFARWAGGRLPTEAEWEYAARSGGQPWAYPWGNEAATCSNAVMDNGSGAGCGRASTWPVCSKPAGNSTQGVCDLAGNVAEWLQDTTHDSYHGAPDDGSAWEDAGSGRIYRGGSWRKPPSSHRASNRSRLDLKSRDGDLGFRLARPAPVDTVEIEWVPIPGGTFEMGSSSGNFDEKPVHAVRISSFELMKTEVTVGQYRGCVEAGACTVPINTSSSASCNWAYPEREDHPINCVDWSQAQAFARWAGGRLPTEAEWEYAARSGGKSWTHPWGNEAATCTRAILADDRGKGCGEATTWPVCSKPAGSSTQGVCDLAGNVNEWVQDGYHDSYSGAPGDGSAWEYGASFRVYRGGGWRYYHMPLRASNRDKAAPSSRFYDLGFRLAR